ncbi:MAG: hypothetical protein QOE61_267 [Micromonosporaceae bacterium]|nr:hypothetical protein [Micromonosporaceae bacterium]
MPHARPTAAAIKLVKDPTARTLLQAMPPAMDLTAGRSDGRFRSISADLLHSAAEATSVAGDILASHVDPINGPRTPEGAAIRLGAGRNAALADLADVITEFAQVDQRLMAWLEAPMRSPSTPFTVLHHDLTDALKSWSTAGVQAVDELRRALRDPINATVGPWTSFDSAAQKGRRLMLEVFEPVPAVVVGMDAYIALLPSPKCMMSLQALSARIDQLEGTEGVTLSGTRLPGRRHPPTAFGDVLGRTHPHRHESAERAENLPDRAEPVGDHRAAP